eukprot:363159-Chlamydomonas_euryale.AAC.7
MRILQPDGGSLLQAEPAAGCCWCFRYVPVWLSPMDDVRSGCSRYRPLGAGRQHPPDAQR